MRAVISLLFYLMALLLSSTGYANDKPSPALAASSPLLQLNNQQESYSVYGHLQQLTDTSGELSFAQVLESYQQQAFKPLKGFLNLGYTQSASWVTFQFQAPDNLNDRYYLWLSTYILNYVDVYIQNGPDSLNPEHYQYFALGDHRPVLSHPYQHSKPLIPLTAEAKKQYRIFIRTQTTSTHALRAWIHSENATINESNKTLIGHVAFIACALVLGVIAWLQAIRLRNSIQFWYGLYLISEGFVQAGVQGVLPVLLPDIAHHIADFVTGGLTGVAYFSLLVITAIVLNSRYEHPWYHRYLISLGLLAIIATLNANNPWYGTVMSVLMPAGLLVMPVATALYYRKFSWHDPSQRLFFLFFVICSLGITIHLLRLTGVIPVNNLTYAAMILNTLLHMVVLNLALSEKLLDAEQKARSSAEASEGKAIALAGEMTKELLISKEQLEIALSKEQQALKEQGRFIDMISHEYRTPLAIIKTNLDILDLKAQPDWQSDNNLQAMTKATERLQEIFDSELRKDHLGYQITPNMQNLPALETLQKIFSDAQSLWLTNRIQLDSTEDLSQCTITADPGLLKTMIFNLLDNAQKYAPAKQQVTCILAGQKGHPDSNNTGDQRWLQIIISNPVTPDAAAHINIDKLCEKYTRGGNSSGSSGLGLGLYLVQQIIEAHNGQLRLSLKNNNFTVSVQLPVTDMTTHSEQAQTV